jgi:hypothetical protein
MLSGPWKQMRWQLSSIYLCLIVFGSLQQSLTAKNEEWFQNSQPNFLWRLVVENTTLCLLAKDTLHVMFIVPFILPVSGKCEQ